MELDLLTAISPIDGRYRGKTDALAAYFSEFALIKYRVQVEVEYFITLCELPLPQLKGVDKGVFSDYRDECYCEECEKARKTEGVAELLNGRKLSIEPNDLDRKNRNLLSKR